MAHFPWRPLDRPAYDTFLRAHLGDVTFLQGWAYGQWRSQLGESVARWGCFDAHDQLVGIAQTVVVSARRGRYLLCPHGPLLSPATAGSSWPSFRQWVKSYARTQRCDWVRLSPLMPASEAPTLTQEGYWPCPVYMTNPEVTIRLDLTQTEDELLAQMKKTTRYEIRKSLKADLTVTQGADTPALEAFWQLHTATAARQGFTPFARTATESQLESYAGDTQIFTVWHDGQPLSSCVIIFDHHAGYYHQGASLRSKLPVAYRGLWAAIVAAKARGCTEFNFWGVSPADKPQHPWYGLSKFKRGWGGTETPYLHAHDLPLTAKYYLNWLLESWRQRKKGYWC